jgi:ABC-type Na+ efflux pump permease subunit
MIAVGFLFYCSLAAIGGSMASKPEDLASTNMIFTLAVVASFLISMFSGTSNGMVSTDKWLIYFPFTAILVTPGRAMTGAVTITEGIISILLVAVFAFFGVLLAGKIYEMMSFYRGNPPTPAKIIAMLRDRKKTDR